MLFGRLDSGLQLGPLFLAAGFNFGKLLDELIFFTQKPLDHVALIVEAQA